MRTPLHIEGATAPPQVLGLTEADVPLCLASQWDTAPALPLAGGSYSCQVNVKHEKATGYLPGSFSCHSRWQVEAFLALKPTLIVGFKTGFMNTLKEATLK